MDSFCLFYEFDKATFSASHPPNRSLNFLFEDTHHWAEFGIVSANVLSERMLTLEVASRDTKKRHDKVEKVSVFLCYNWRLKAEFVLVRQVLETTFSYYTPQYGRDNNYNNHVRRDYHFLTFSVEAFKRERPELASCLDNL